MRHNCVCVGTIRNTPVNVSSKFSNSLSALRSWVKKHIFWYIFYIPTFDL